MLLILLSKLKGNMFSNSNRNMLKQDQINAIMERVDSIEDENETRTFMEDWINRINALNAFKSNLAANSERTSKKCESCDQIISANNNNILKKRIKKHNCLIKRI